MMFKFCRSDTPPGVGTSCGFFASPSCRLDVRVMDLPNPAAKPRGEFFCACTGILSLLFNFFAESQQASQKEKGVASSEFARRNRGVSLDSFHCARIMGAGGRGGDPHHRCAAGPRGEPDGTVPRSGRRRRPALSMVRRRTPGGITGIPKVESNFETKQGGQISYAGCQI